MKYAERLEYNHIERAAKKIRMLALPIRMEIVRLLEENKKLNVTQIYQKLNMQQAEASLHLGLMREHGVIRKVRDGKMSFYSLNGEVMEKIIRIVNELNSDRL